MAECAQPIDREVDAVRSFNRFYTRQIGLLNERLLESAFSLTEARILYELAHRDGLTAAGLGRELGLDGGYLSRILKAFEARGIVTRTPAADDARRAVLHLTPAGRDAFKPLSEASRQQVSALLAGLSQEERADLCKAMSIVQRLLGGTPEPRTTYLLRPHRVGDIGWIVHRQAVLYAQEYGWEEGFEALLAQIGADLLNSFDARRDCCWIAERQGEIVGSVVVMREADAVARLRLLYVEPRARGLGIGGRLVEESVRFSRAAGYRRLTLWTNDVLVSARRIYEAAGFRLVSEERHRSFGKELVGQNWELDL